MTYSIFKNLKLFIFVFVFTQTFFGQQKADNIEVSEIDNPNYKFNKGPKLYIDHLHQNFHKISGRFKPFADLLKNDGYRVDSLINLRTLKKEDVLVIANPIDKKNIGNWRRPIYNAFTVDEIKFIKNWVKRGGKLLLIADHMPFAGAANTLGKAFGFEFCDGFAYQKKVRNNTPDFFSLENKRLIPSKITSNKNTYIESITTFTGSSFSIPEDAKGILRFKKEDYCLAPDIAWQFNETTIRKNLKDKYQGAILEFGKGKVAVFGEAAMFTAQTITNNSGTFKFGFHSKQAPNNIQFIRNLMCWLSK